MKGFVFRRVTTRAPAPLIEALQREGSPELLREPRQAGRRRVGAVVAGVVALIVVAGSALALRGRKDDTPAADAPQTATVARRDFVHILRLSGTVQAVQSRAVLAPALAGSQVGSLVVTKLVPAGNRVETGDLLVEFDRQAQTKAFLDKQAEYRDFVDQIAGKQAEEDAARAKDATELKQAEDDLKKAELEMQKNEVLSKIDAEKNQENLDQARANLKQLRETFELKRRAAQAGIHTLEIQRDRSRETMLHAQKNAEKMAVHSPMDGVVVLNTIWKGGKMGEVQEGDEVRAGVPFMQVVDPSAMLVRVPVNQADYLELKIGQQAQVRLDAYPEMVFRATLDALTPLGVHGEFSDKIRTFAALFAIQGSDPKLMPDLSAAVDVELESQKNVLLAPLDSIAVENNHPYVWVKSGLGFEKRAVTVGPRNDLEAVIQSGLRAGDVVKRNIEPLKAGS